MMTRQREGGRALNPWVTLAASACLTIGMMASAGVWAIRVAMRVVTER